MPKTSPATERLRSSRDPISRKFSYELRNQNCEAHRRRVNDEVLEPGMAGRQRNLAQFEQQRKNDRAQQHRSQWPGVGQPENQPRGSEGAKMFKIVLKSGDRAFVGWHDTGDDQGTNKDPAHCPEKICYHKIPKWRFK